MRIRYLTLLAALCAAPALAQPTTFFQQLSSAAPAASSQFGAAVDLGGDFVAVGEPGASNALGAAYIYLRDPDSDTWTLQQELVATTVQTGGEFDPAFGQAIAIDGMNTVVGAPYDSETEINSGAAVVFRYDIETSMWIEFDKFKAEVPALEDQFGFSVAISGAIAVVGAYGDDDGGDQAGAAYVYTADQESGAWDFLQKLVADDAEPGDRFGFSVAVQGETIGVGIFNELSPTDAGATYVFERETEDTLWMQTQKLEASDAEAGDRFGSAVGIDADAIIVGAPLGGVDDSGAAYIFERDGDAWTETERLVAQSPMANGLFGDAVSIQNGVAIVGAPQEDGAGTGEGAAYVFVNNGLWVPLARLEAPTPEAGAAFGSAVNVNAGIAVVGSPQYDGSAADAGAAFLFGVPTTSAEDDATASTFRLDAPYPNPFTTATTFAYSLDKPAEVTLAVFDVLGREVVTVERGLRPAGQHTVPWTAARLPSGIYVVRLSAGDTSVTRRLVLAR